MIVIDIMSLQVIRKSKCLDEVLSKMDSSVSANHQKAIRKWKMKREMGSPREGAFLLFSQKKLAKTKARCESVVLTDGREAATLQVQCVRHSTSMMNAVLTSLSNNVSNIQPQS